MMNAAVQHGHGPMKRESRVAPVRSPENWSPISWRTRTAVQQPSYADPLELESALHKLRELPPLVTSWEILALKKQIAELQAKLAGDQPAPTSGAGISPEV